MSRPIYTQGWTDERKLLMKLVEVYKQVQYIQKRGKNKFHGYSYATEADVNEKVREELSQRNVIMIPEIINKEMRTTTTKSGNTEYIYRVDIEFVIMDAETGESLLVQMSGEGQDVGDKAIFKAISGCQKYALMKAFMIPTGDDPEGDDEADKRNHGIYQQPTTTTTQSARTTSQTTTQPDNSGQQQTGAKDPSKRVYGLMNEMGWEFPDLNKFATDVFQKQITYLKNQMKGEEDWNRLYDAMKHYKEHGNIPA